MANRSSRRESAEENTSISRIGASRSAMDEAGVTDRSATRSSLNYILRHVSLSFASDQSPQSLSLSLFKGLFSSVLAFILPHYAHLRCHGLSIFSLCASEDCTANDARRTRRPVQPTTACFHGLHNSLSRSCEIIKHFLTIRTALALYQPSASTSVDKTLEVVTRLLMLP